MFVKYLKKIKPLRYFGHLLRQQKMITKLYDSRHIRNLRKIEIDITYQCNLKCLNCNRSCTQAPSHDRMSVEQIEKFVSESVEKNIRWESIMVVGGEPTLHPNLIEILNILIEYKEKNSDKTSIVIATNGAGHYVKSVLSRVPRGVEFRDTEKDVEKYNHEAFNDAPQDSILYRFSDYSYACPMSSWCGTGLTPYGYYLCPIAGGGIDRIFGFDMGRKQMPDNNDQMTEQKLLFCKLCGHFKERKAFNKNIVSPTWEEAYKKYRNSKPFLTRY